MLMKRAMRLTPERVSECSSISIREMTGYRKNGDSEKPDNSDTRHRERGPPWLSGSAGHSRQLQKHTHADIHMRLMPYRLLSDIHSGDHSDEDSWPITEHAATCCA